VSRLLVLLIVLIVVAGCASDDRERLVVYSPHGKELLEAYELAFEAEHPEVDVVWLDMGAQDAYDRVRTERANPQASLWWGAPQTLYARAAEEGLLQTYTPTWADAVGQDARDEQDRWLGTYLTPEVIAFNTEALDSTPTVAEGYRWLARLDMSTKTYTADPTQLYLKLARGEGDLTLWNMPDIVLQRDESGYPFDYHLPISGTPVLVDAIAVVANSPNQELAKQFYEFVTTSDALIDQARRFHRIPARRDVPADSLPGWMQALELQAMPLDWDRLATEGPDWMQYWDENIRGRGEEYLGEHATE